MADNFSATQGSGVLIRTDELTTGVQVQAVKIILGADGEEDFFVDGGQQLAANSVPVTIASDQNAVPVSDAGGALTVDGKVAITENYAPVGAHSSGASIATATTLTKPDGATQIILQPIGQNIRFRLDGVAPTASTGFRITAGNDPTIIAVPGASIIVIQEAATATLEYQWIS